eukprot:1140065-Pelagomonas_calceolata.AAC.10
MPLLDACTNPARLFNVSQPPTGSTRPVAGQLGARSSMAERATSNKRGPPTKHHSLRHIPKVRILLPTPATETLITNTHIEWY